MAVADPWESVILDPGPRPIYFNPYSFPFHPDEPFTTGDTVTDVNTTAGDIGLANAPEHYRGKGIQPFDVYDAYEMDFYLGNSFKYLTRWKKKGGLNDLQKSEHYLREAMLRYDNGVLGWKRLKRCPDLTPTMVVEGFGMEGHTLMAAMRMLHARFECVGGKDDYLRQLYLGSAQSSILAAYDEEKAVIMERASLRAAEEGRRLDWHRGGVED